MSEQKKMRHLTYTIRVHPADPDETGYWVDVPALPGCVTQGETFDEAVEHARDAIEGFIETLIEVGEEVPIENHPIETVAVGVKIPVAL